MTQATQRYITELKEAIKWEELKLFHSRRQWTP